VESKKKKEVTVVTQETARRRVSVLKTPPAEKQRPVGAVPPQVSSSTLKFVPELDKDDQSSEDDNALSPREDDIYNNVTGDYDKIVDYDATKFTPAREAVELGNMFAFSEAVEKMPGVNMQDPTDQENTILHWAVAYNRVDMVKVLLRRGARNLANNVGKTPLEISKEAYAAGDTSFFELNNLLISGLKSLG